MPSRPLRRPRGGRASGRQSRTQRSSRTHTNQLRTSLKGRKLAQERATVARDEAAHAGTSAELKSSPIHASMSPRPDGVVGTEPACASGQYGSSRTQLMAWDAYRRRPICRSPSYKDDAGSPNVPPAAQPGRLAARSRRMFPGRHLQGHTRRQPARRRCGQEFASACRLTNPPPRQLHRGRTANPPHEIVARSGSKFYFGMLFFFS